MLSVNFDAMHARITPHFRWTFRLETTIFLFAFSMHLIFFALFALTNGTSVFWEGPQDVDAYTTLAKNFLHYGNYVNYSGVLPESWYTPGYPIFLAIAYSIFKSWIPVVIVQNLLASFSAVLLYRLGKKYFSERHALLAAMLFAIEPTNAYISNFLWSETIFLFFILLFVSSFIRFIESDCTKKQSVIFAGLWLAIAIYIRQIAFLLPLFILLSLGIVYIMGWVRLKKNTLVALSLFFTIIIGAIAPWILRNKIIFDSWSIGGSSGIMLYFYDAVPFAYFRNASSHVKYLFGLENPTSPEGNINPTSIPPEMHYRGKGGLLYEQFLIDKAKKIILPHPIQYAAFHMVSGFGAFAFQDTWQFIINRLGYGTPGLSRALISLDKKKIRGMLSSDHIRWFTVNVSGHLFWLFITTTAVIGSLRLLNGDTLEKLLSLICIALICYFALVTGPAAYRERYRYPVTPFYFLLSAGGMLYLLDERNKIVSFILRTTKKANSK